MNKTALYELMSQNRYGVVSSVSDAGVPQSALVGIAVTPELQIIFDTLKTSRKYKNLIARPACSIVIGWSDEQTIQLEGRAEEPEEEDLKRFHEFYFTVWPDCLAHLHWPDIAYLVIHPRWIRYSNYNRKPPLIEEITVDFMNLDLSFPLVEGGSGDVSTYETPKS